MKLSSGHVISLVPALVMTDSNRENINKWIAALRSGKYKQTNGRLRRGEAFCCLGVACDVLSPSSWECYGGFMFSGSFSENCLSQEIQDEFGLDRSLGIRVECSSGKDSREVTLAALNDNGATFNDIAQILEYAMNGGYTA